VEAVDVTEPHMLDPDSRKPTKVEVTVYSGTDKSRTLPAKIIGIDRGTDLAVVRIEDKEPPAGLKFGTTTGLN